MNLQPNNINLKYNELFKIISKFGEKLNDTLLVEELSEYLEDIYLMLKSNASIIELQAYFKNILNIYHADYVIDNKYADVVTIDREVSHLTQRLSTWYLKRPKELKETYYFNLDYIGLTHFSFNDISNPVDKNLFNIYSDNPSCGKPVFVNTDHSVMITNHDFSLYVYHHFHSGHNQTIKLEFELIVNGELEILNQTVESESSISHIPIYEKNIVAAISQLLLNIKQYNTKIVSFHNQGRSRLDERTIEIHCLNHSKNSSDNIKKTILRYKNAHAHIKYDASDMQSLMASIYTGNLQEIIRMLKLQPKLIDTPIIDQNLRTGAIEIISFPLIEAIFTDQPEIIDFLIKEAHADIQVKTTTRLTPLSAAILMNNKKLKNQILQAT